MSYIINYTDSATFTCGGCGYTTSHKCNRVLAARERLHTKSCINGNGKITKTTIETQQCGRNFNKNDANISGVANHYRGKNRS